MEPEIVVLLNLVVVLLAVQLRVQADASAEGPVSRWALGLLANGSLVLVILVCGAWFVHHFA